LILGIERNNKWNPIPKGEELILKGDKLVVYGPIKTINEIFKTPE
jgi:Trk K+ transport system NAD-binding subunit